MNSLAPALDAAIAASEAVPFEPTPQQQPKTREVEVPVTFKTTNRKGFISRIKGAVLFPFAWIAAMLAQTMRGLALITVMCTLAAVGGIVLYDVYLTPTASVTFRHGSVGEKGWFGNLLWRHDSSKTFQVETQKSLLFGTEASVTARRSNGEVTTLGNDGVWHLLKK